MADEPVATEAPQGQTGARPPRPSKARATWRVPEAEQGQVDEQIGPNDGATTNRNSSTGRVGQQIGTNFGDTNFRSSTVTVVNQGDPNSVQPTRQGWPQADPDVGPAVAVGQPPNSSARGAEIPAAATQQQTSTRRNATAANSGTLGAGNAASQAQPSQEGVAQVDSAAWQVLQHAFATLAVEGEVPDSTREGQRQFESGAGPSTVSALRALASVGRARGRRQDAAGRALYGAGVERVTRYLEGVAQWVESAVSSAASGVPALPTRPRRPVRAGAEALFDVLDQDLQALATTEATDRATAQAGLGGFPREVTTQTLRQGPEALQGLVRGMGASARRLENVPVGVPMALLVVNEVLTTKADVPARTSAVRLVGRDLYPRHTAVRVRQFADLLDARIPQPDDQRSALGTFDRGQNLAEYLRAVAGEIEAIVDDPAARVQARVTGLLGARARAATVGPVSASLAPVGYIVMTPGAVAPTPPASSSALPADAGNTAEPVPQPAPAPRAAQRTTPPPAATGTAAPPAPVTPAPRTAAPTPAPETGVAAAAPTPSAEVAPPVGGAAPAEPVRKEDTRAQPDAIPYTFDPDLVHEHALLGSLLHAPIALGDLTLILEPTHFSKRDHQAVFSSLRGLHKAGLLYDVAAVPETRRSQAVADNHQRLIGALRADPPVYTDIKVGNVPKVLAELLAAAPPEAAPHRGVHDREAQIDLGKRVLRDHFTRQITSMGVRLRPAVPLANKFTRLGEWNAHLAVERLTAMQDNLAAMSTKLVDAVTRFGPVAQEEGTGEVPKDARMAAAAAIESKRPLTDRFRALTAPLAHRAERHLIHLALHTGRSDYVSDALLDLTPDFFADPAHANTWATIRDLHAQGVPLNHVAVFDASRETGFGHSPVLPTRELIAMGQPPDVRPERVARSLNSVVSSALARAQKDSKAAMAAVAVDAVPIEDALTEASDKVGTLLGKATTGNSVLARQREHTTRREAGRAAIR